MQSRGGKWPGQQQSTRRLVWGGVILSLVAHTFACSVYHCDKVHVKTVCTSEKAQRPSTLTDKNISNENCRESRFPRPLWPTLGSNHSTSGERKCEVCGFTAPDSARHICWWNPERRQGVGSSWVRVMPAYSHLTALALFPWWPSAAWLDSCLETRCMGIGPAR